ncbi:MAG TPA: alanine racemase, partial [Candidatus Aminicenantes bacterium]|nr:alanine racemase [Candidatus Aminicenantes bacterium]
MSGPCDGRFWQWIEIDRKALASNVRRFRALAGPRRLLLAVVKANAYGHGLIETSGPALAAGVDWLGVHSAEEGLALREAG